MTRFTCEGFRAIERDDSTYETSPAWVFAARQARLDYGRRGIVHNVNIVSWGYKGSWASYDAFIGKPVKGGGCVGRNVTFTVYKDS